MRSSQRATPYVFIAPFFVLFLLFWLWPILFSAILSNTDWSGVGRIQFNGFKNFVNLLAHDSTFTITVRNTFYIAAGSVFLIVPLALLIAMTLNHRSLRWRNVLRLAIFLPVVMSLVIASMIFLNLLDYNAGILRYWLGFLGLKMPDLLSSETWSMPTLIGILVWRWTGYNMLFFLAGLQSIPEEILEAARIDGVNRLQSFLYVVFPMLKPVTVFVLVQSLIGAFQVFEEPLIITGGGPAYSSLTMALYLYNRAFRNLRFGYASAVALFQFAIIFVLAFLALRLTGAFKKE
jgi:multiple sugar transport system permease protein